MICSFPNIFEDTSNLFCTESTIYPSATVFDRQPPCLLRTVMSAPASANNVADVLLKQCPVPGIYSYCCLVHFPFRKPSKNRVISIGDGRREKYVLNISNKSKPSKLPGDIVNSRLTFVLVSGIWIMI
jgi:hypothetical protein